VIELGGEAIAAAHNTVEGAHDPTAHAEMLALTQAASRSATGGSPAPRCM
jgi:tRNA(adenine34) deaminase